MKKILLIRPPMIDVKRRYRSSLSNDKYVKFHSFASQPTGILRIGAYLKSRGFDVELIDCCAEVDATKVNSTLRKRFYDCRNAGLHSSLALPRYIFGMDYSGLEKRIIAANPDVIMIGSTMTYYYETIHETVKICKRVYPGVPVIIGGLYTSLCREHALSSGADAVFVGELSQANDIATDLDLLGYVPHYAVIKSTRGCPNNCSYCVVPRLEGRCMRYRSPDLVIQDIVDKIEKYGMRKFVFWESNLLINAPNHFEKILDKIIEKRLQVYLTTPEGLQPSLLYERLARKMKRAGFRKASLPLETIDDEYNRKHLQRAAKVEEFERAVSILKKCGFQTKNITVFVLIGLPGQGLDNVLDSIVKVYEHRCSVALYPFTPIPGSAEYEKNISLLWEKKLEELHPMLLPMVEDESLLKDLLCLGRLNSKGLACEYIAMLRTRPLLMERLIRKIRMKRKVLDKVIEQNLDRPGFRCLYKSARFTQYGLPGQKAIVIGKDPCSVADALRLKGMITSYACCIEESCGFGHDIIVDTDHLLFLVREQQQEFFSWAAKALKKGGLLITRIIENKEMPAHLSDNYMGDYVAVNRYEDVLSASSAWFSLEKEHPAVWLSRKDKCYALANCMRELVLRRI